MNISPELERRVKAAMEAEKELIRARKDHVDQLVNEATERFLCITRRLFGVAGPSVEAFSFSFELNWQRILGWVEDLDNGYYSKSSRNQHPKQWLSSNKARKFAMGLFPQMFTAMKIHAAQVADRLEAMPMARDFVRGHLMAEYYSSVLIASMGGGKGAGSRPIVCDHSFQRKTSIMLDILTADLNEDSEVDNHPPTDWPDRKPFFAARFKELSQLYYAKFIISKQQDHGARVVPVMKREDSDGGRNLHATASSEQEEVEEDEEEADAEVETPRMVDRYESRRSEEMEGMRSELEKLALENRHLKKHIDRLEGKLTSVRSRFEYDRSQWNRERQHYKEQWERQNQEKSQLTEKMNELTQYLSHMQMQALQQGMQFQAYRQQQQQQQRMRQRQRQRGHVHGHNGHTGRPEDQRMMGLSPGGPLAGMPGFPRTPGGSPPNSQSQLDLFPNPYDSGVKPEADSFGSNPLDYFGGHNSPGIPYPGDYESFPEGMESVENMVRARSNSGDVAMNALF